MFTMRFITTTLVIVLGLIQASAFDIGFSSPLAPFAGLISIVSLVGFLALIINKSPKQAVGWGYLYGLSFFAWGLNWVHISMNQYGGAGLGFALLANAFVITVLALYWGFAAYLIVKIGRTRCRRLLLAPAIIALLEWVRSVFFIGFPWLSLGYAQVDNPVLNHVVRFGGVFFASFMAVAIASCIVFMFLKISNRQVVKVNVYRFLAAPVILLVAIIFMLNSAVNSESKSTTEYKTISLLQGNIDVITKFNPERMDDSMLTYLQLTDQVLAESKPDVVVWSETAIPYFYSEVPEVFNAILQQQRSEQFDFITGIPHANLETKQIYNAIVFQSKDKQSGGEDAFYHKQHLLPFGEYLPFRRLFAFFRDYVNIPMSDFSRGDIVQPPFQAGGMTFAPSICFEAVFGDEFRQNARQAGALLNISNDGWFGHSKAQSQHLNIARIRAIENQKYLVRATNNGISAIINPKGKVVKTTAPFEAGIVTGQIQARHDETFYAKYGDKPWLLLLVVLVLVIRFWRG